MLYSTVSAADKRAAFRARLASGETLQLPGAFNPLSARLIEDKGFDGVYISGAVISADLGLPDIGLTTLSEVAQRAGDGEFVADRGHVRVEGVAVGLADAGHLPTCGGAHRGLGPRAVLFFVDVDGDAPLLRRIHGTHHLPVRFHLSG